MSISAIWQQAWEKFKNGNWVIGVVLIVLTVFLSFVPFVGIFFSYLLGVCLSYYGLQVWRSDSPVDFRSVFPPIMAFLKILLGSILIAGIPGLIILVSAYDFVMDIIKIAQVAQEVSSEPEVHLKGDSFAKSLEANFLLIGIGFLAAVILSVVFYFYSYFILERNEGVLASFQGSFALFSQMPGKVILFLLTQMLVVLLGILACGVGLLIASPVSAIAAAGFYMSHRPEPSGPQLTLAQKE